MAILFGARTNKGERKDTESQIVNLALKKIISKTSAGEFSNVAEIDAAIGAMSNLPASVELEGAIADLEAKRSQISVKQSDMQNSEGIFRDNLNDALKEEASNNFKNIDELVRGYSEIYNDAEEKMDEFVNKSVYEQYGSSTKPSDGLINLKKEIKDKARYYSTLQFAISDPSLYGSIDAESLGVSIRTNPVTRKIVSVDVLPISEIPKDMMKTDIKARFTKAGGSPSSNIFVNTVDLGYDESGKAKVKRGVLGGVDFQGNSKPITVGGDVEEGGFLEAQKKNTTMFDWFIWGDKQREEDANENTNSWINDAKGEGVTLDSFSFDGNDIPNGSVVRKGNRLYYQTKDSNVVEFGGSDTKSRFETGKKYLESIGENVNKLNSPYYGDDSYFVQEGKSRVKQVIDDKYFQAPAIENTPVSSLQDMGSQFTPMSVSPQTSHFGARVAQANSQAVNTPNKPEVARESIGGRTLAGEVIDKAKSFFRNRVA